MPVGWVVLGVWIGAVVLAAVVLLFCLYEINWKSRRLQSGLGQLQQLQTQVADLQAQLSSIEQRRADVMG